MTLSMTWGGTAISPLPDNEGILPPGKFIGSAARMANAALRVDVIGEKREIELDWSGLSYAELAGLRSLYDTKASAANTLAHPDGRSWSVIGIHNGWQEGKAWWDHADVARYPLKIVLEEV